MMNSDDVLALLDKIAATPGKNDKIAAVTAAITDPLFERVMVAMYHPLTTYGVRKLPANVEKYADGVFDESTFELIANLANRTLSGNAAQDSIAKHLGILSDASGQLLKRIILKDARAGFDAETVNKGKKGLLPEFPYMRCSLPKAVKLDKFFEHGAISQVKADGQYLNIDVRLDGEVQFRTRQGNEYPAGAFSKIEADILANVRLGSQLQGEMLVLEDGKVMSRKDGNGVLTHVRNGGDFAENQEPLFMVWDQIPLAVSVPKGKYKVPYLERLLSLCDQLLEGGTYPGFDERLAAPAKTTHLAVIESRWVKDMPEALAHYRENLLKKLEGSVVKRATAIWADGTSREQIKLKLKVPVELRIKGFVEGSGKYAGTLGAFKMESECGQLKVNVNGRGDDHRDEVWANQEKYLEGVATVEGNDILTPGGSSPFYSLFLPVLVEIRNDKSTADDLKRIQDQFESAIAG